MSVFSSRPMSLWFRRTICLSVLSLVPLLAQAKADLDDRLPLSQWEYHWGDSATETGWQPLPQSLVAPDRGDQSTLLLRSVLPASTWRDASVFIPGMFMTFSISVDDIEIYRFDDANAARSTPWHLVTIPNGKRLELKVHSTYSKIGPMGPIWYGERAAHVSAMIERDFSRLGLGFFFLILSLVAALLFLRTFDFVYCAFAVLVLAIGGYTLRYTQVKTLIGPDEEFWFVVWSLSLIVIMVSFLAFIIRVFGNDRWSVLRYLLLANQLVSAVAFAILVAGALDIETHKTINNITLATLRSLYVITLLAVLLYTGMLALRSNRDAQILLLGLPLAMIFVVRDALWAMGLISGESTVGHWGAFVFVMTLVGILGNRYAETNRQLLIHARQIQQSAREKSLLVSDLHDGIGSITTNIAYLSAAAKANDDLSEVDRNLESIGDLAEQGLTEIRSYMHSLDSDHESWGALVADMRRYGSQTLEPQSIDLSFHVACYDENALTSSLLSLNLFRIYREALTNVVKHASARTVIVDMAISPGSLHLTIKDDGESNPAGTDPSTDTSAPHRGTQNMVARAEQLGGKLSITQQNGTLIECTIPLPIQLET